MAEISSAAPKGRVEAPSAEATRAGNYCTPQVDICETDQELVLFADLPGVRPEDVDLRYEQGELLLHGRVPSSSPGGPFLLHEYGTGDFYRVFSIHESIDSSRISAECQNGVLVVHLPKQEALQPRQITVRGA